MGKCVNHVNHIFILPKISQPMKHINERVNAVNLILRNSYKVNGSISICNTKDNLVDGLQLNEDNKNLLTNNYLFY